MSGTRVINHVRVALAYVTSDDQLLVQEGIDETRGGLRVPARMVNDETSPEEAAFRELQIKSGLESVRLREKLGHYSHDMSPMLEEIQERHVFWYEYSGDRRDAWRASGPGTPDAGAEMYYWVDIRDIPELFAGQGRYLDELGLRLVGRSDEAATIDENSEAWPSELRTRA